MFSLHGSRTEITVKEVDAPGPLRRERGGSSEGSMGTLRPGS